MRQPTPVVPNANRARVGSLGNSNPLSDPDLPAGKVEITVPLGEQPEASEFETEATAAKRAALEALADIELPPDNDIIINVTLHDD